MKILLFANTDWYLYNFRKALAEELKKRYADVILMSPRGAFADRLMQSQFHWICAPMKREGINPVAQIPTIINLARIYFKEKPDLSQHFTLKCIILGTIAAKLSGTPCIVNSITGLGYIFANNSLKARLLSFVIKPILRIILSFNNSVVILQNSDDSKELVNRKFVSRNRVILIKGSGVNTETFRPYGRSRNQVPKVLFSDSLNLG